MDCSPETQGGCVSGEMIPSALPSMRKMDPEVILLVSAQLTPLLHHICAGISMAIAVLMRPADLMRAFSAPPVPCECPNDPISFTLSFWLKRLWGSLLAFFRKFAPSRTVCPGPVFMSCVAITTNPHEAMCLR